jgi:RNA polymerase sigma-70 factor, ECF subfamily
LEATLAPPNTTEARVCELALAALARGDLDAVGTLYDHLSSSVFGLALRTTRDRALAEDVVQETFVAAWRNAAQFDAERGSARSWILTIARNRAIDVLRRRKAASSLGDHEDNLPSDGAGGDWANENRRTDAVMLADGLATLPGPQRTAVELAFMQGLSHPQIAATLGVPLGTVKSRVRLGLLRLRDYCAPA